MLLLYVTLLVCGAVELSTSQLCGNPVVNPNSLTPRIVGGRPAQEMSWPWMGSLRASSRGPLICGATLISNQWAITAAHCVGGLSHIVLGDTLLDTPTQYSVERAIQSFPHPQFDPETFENDIALVRLEEPVTFTPGVRPACLSEATRPIGEYSNCWVTGWGDLTEGGFNSPNSLQEAPLPITPTYQCSLFLGSQYFDEIMLCSDSYATAIDTCQGDSGGPFICENTNGYWDLVGVVSFGPGCARPNQPGAYAKVSAFGDFIASIMNDEYLPCGDGTVFSRSQRCDQRPNCDNLADEENCPGIPFTGCVEVLSPNFPSPYRNFANEVWLFEASNPFDQLRLSFIAVNIEDQYDFLFVGQGWDYNDNNTVLLEHTGFVTPGDVVTPGNRMWIRFRSDEAVALLGFFLRVTVDGGVPSCPIICSFSQNELTVLEDVQFGIVSVRVSCDRTVPVNGFSLGINYAESTAMSPEDFIAEPVSVLFPAWLSVLYFDVRIVDDALEENPESFIISAGNVAFSNIEQLPSGYTLLFNGAVTVTIIDDDSDDNSGTVSLPVSIGQCPLPSTVMTIGNIATFMYPRCLMDMGRANCDKDPGTEFNQGDTTVTCECEDEDGDVVDSCDFVVSIDLARQNSRCLNNECSP